jgi:hypothetical protein
MGVGELPSSSPFTSFSSFGSLFFYLKNRSKASLGEGLGRGMLRGLKGEEGRKMDEAPWREEGSRVSEREEGE